MIRRKSHIDGIAKNSLKDFEDDDDDESLMDQDEPEMEAVKDDGQVEDLNRPRSGINPSSIPIQLGERSIFHTFRPEGGMRDVLTVECQQINGEDFKGTVTYTEATVKIFQQELGFSADILHAVKMSFNKYRTPSFKLKKQINIDELVEKENFEMSRSYMLGNEIKTDVIACKIIGIRKPKTTPEAPRPSFDGSENDVQWVEIGNCQYSITEGELNWLNLSMTAFKLQAKRIFLTQ